MKLRIRAMAMSAGILLGVSVFVVALYSLWFGAGESIYFFNWIFPGFQRSFLGAVIGLVAGFAYGFVAGGLLAWLYNSFYKVFYKNEIHA